MGSNAEIIKILKKKIKRFAARQLPSLGASLLIVGLIGFALYSCLDLNPLRLETTPVVRSTEYEITALTGYIFRDEEVIYSQNTGAAVYSVKNGERLALGSELAKVYTTGNTADYLERRLVLEEKIALLERSTTLGRQNAASVDETRRLLSKSYNSIMNSLARGDLSAGAGFSEDFIVALNAYDLIRGEGEAVTARLAALKAELSMLGSRYGANYESLTNQRTGYFFYGVDGYEKIFSFDKIATLDASSLASMAAASPDFSATAGQAVGKMVYDYLWYLAVPADAYLCEKLSPAYGCNITFSGGLELWMTLERVSYVKGEERGLLIFSSGQMPEGFNYARVQQIELLVSEISGYRVPVSAIREQKGIKGVYILSSSTLLFRRVNIIYEGDGYVVVAERDTSAENYKEYLDLNDEIIISISDGEFYDGRLLN